MLFWFCWHWKMNNKAYTDPWPCLFVSVMWWFPSMFSPFCSVRSYPDRWSKRDWHFFWIHLSAYTSHSGVSSFDKVYGLVFELPNRQLCLVFTKLVFSCTLNEYCRTSCQWEKNETLLLMSLTGHQSNHKERNWAVILIKSKETSLWVRSFLP